MGFQESDGSLMFRTCMVPQGSSSKTIVIKKREHVFLFERWYGHVERTVDITVESGASCVFVTLNSAESAEIVQRGTVKEGARLHWINITCGGYVQHTLESCVSGKGGTSTIDWVCLGMETAEYHLSARSIFDAPSGRGDITIHGAALDAARVQCDGKIDITARAEGTETRLCEGVLILDPKASVRVIPCLDVRTNNVKASHAATVSRLTDDDLFYFGSRGIEREVARQMLIEGFLGEIINRIPDKEIRAKILKNLIKKPAKRGSRGFH